jgi:hypothetical protein
VTSETDIEQSRVCEVEGGKYIAFWRGQLVHRLDGALRYFASERDARAFLGRREGAGSSMLGTSPAPRRPQGLRRGGAQRC